MEKFNQVGNSNERQSQPEQSKGSKVGRLIKAIGFLAAGGVGGGLAVEAHHQVGVFSPERTAMSAESPDLLGISVPEAGAFVEFWEENKEDVLSLVLSENGSDSTLGKEFVEVMTQAIHKVEEIAEMEADLKVAHEELRGMYTEIQLKQKQLDAQGVSFDVDPSSNEELTGEFTDWNSWNATVTPGELLKEQVEIGLSQERTPIDLNEEK